MKQWSPPPVMEQSIRGVLCRAKPTGLFQHQSSRTSNWMQSPLDSHAPWLPFSPLSPSLLLSSSYTMVILADTTHKGLYADCILYRHSSFLFLLQLWSSTAFVIRMYSGTLHAAVYHISGIPAQLSFSSSASSAYTFFPAPCIPSYCSVGSFRECMSARLQPWGGWFFLL